MATFRIRNSDRELTLHFYRAPGERNQLNDIRANLRNLGLETRLLRKNPVTHDVWMLVLDFMRNHGEHTAIGAVLSGLISLWLKQLQGRRVEIERHDLKIRAANAKELKKALDALHEYDEVTLTLNNGKPAKPLTEKSPALKRKRKSE